MLCYIVLYCVVLDCIILYHIIYWHIHVYICIHVYMYTCIHVSLWCGQAVKLALSTTKDKRACKILGIINSMLKYTC